MKLEKNNRYFTVSLYAFLWSSWQVFCFPFLFNISYFLGLLSKLIGILLPFIYGFSIAYLLNPSDEVAGKQRDQEGVQRQTAT